MSVPRFGTSIFTTSAGLKLACMYENGLFNATGVNISTEADHLLGPDQRVCTGQVIRPWAKTRDIG